MIEQINAVRMEHGLPALGENRMLAEAAKGQAVDLSRNQWLIDSGRWHEGSDGSSIEARLRRAGYRARQWREIVGWGWGGDGGRMMDWWMASPVHRDAILAAEVTECGTAYLYAPGSVWGAYWCVDFGRPVESVARPYSVNVPVVVGSGVNPSNSMGLDLLEYLRGDGRAYMVLHPSGAAEKFRTVERPQHRWLQLKNSQWEEFWYTEDFIWRGADTSPGDGQYYRQFEDGAQGARWCPRRMAVGESWRSPVAHTVQTYGKDGCRPAEHHRNGRATNALTLAARHERMTWNGVTVEDVVELRTHTGEIMFFGRGWGLVAWGSAWGSSAIAHVLPAHEADNRPEGGCFG